MKRKQEKRNETKRKDTRPLTVNGEQWEYKIGNRCIAIHAPDGKRYFPRIDSFFSEATIEYRNHRITPSFILNHILVDILKLPPLHHKCNYCGDVGADVEFRSDPFNLEIHDDRSQHYLCKRCVAHREEEI